MRDILRKVGSDTPVVSEMLDDRNRVLASVADVDDVVVSGEIVSLLVTQLSEDQRLEPVFRELLGSEGSEIYLRPAEWYVQPGEDVSYATIVAGASRRNETAIGLKSASLAEDGSTSAWSSTRRSRRPSRSPPTTAWSCSRGLIRDATADRIVVVEQRARPSVRTAS